MAEEKKDGVWRTMPSGARVFFENGKPHKRNIKKELKKQQERQKEKYDRIQQRLRKQFGKNDKNNVASPLTTFEEQLEYINKNQEQLHNIVKNAKDIDKETCIYLQERNKFNNKPEVLNSSDYEELSNEEYIKVYRGYHNGEKSTTEYIEQFKYGKNEYGTGQVKCGVGHYTITQLKDAEIYGKTIEIAIPKNAKIVNYSDVREMHYQNFKKYNDDLEYYYNKYGEKVTDILDQMNYANTSAVAIMNNIDVIHDGDMYIILNRGIIKVKE